MKSKYLFAVFIYLPTLSYSATLFGIDVLKKEKFKSLEGANVALITNQTGASKDGTSTVQLFQEAPKIKLKCFLVPEHGFKGDLEHGQAVSNSSDEKTHIPIYSLYGQTSRPTPEMLEGVDTIVFDIQDVGTRFYTYISTLGQALEEAAKKKIHFVVLDRPNPIRGDVREGDLLDPEIKRLTGYFRIPVRHGLTVGELAQWMNKTQKLGAYLTVIPMKKWKRSDWYDQTGYDFIPPSPNIRSLFEALLYSGIGCFEATNLSVGRGTSTPFEVIGAPWLEGKAFCGFLRQQKFPGVVFETIHFTPTEDLYKDELCEGVRMTITDRNAINPFHIFLAAFLYLNENYAHIFKPDWEEIRVVTGSNKLKEAADSSLPYRDLAAQYQNVLESFTKEIKPFYLY